MRIPKDAALITGKCLFETRLLLEEIRYSEVFYYQWLFLFILVVCLFDLKFLPYHLKLPAGNGF